MQKLLFWGPVLTASGYGEHARQLLRGILESGKFDVSVCGVKWGHCSFLTGGDEFIDKIRALVQKYEAEKASNPQYDISIQVTIPNEFQKLGRVNIGVTAGIEVDRVSPEWIKKANDVCDLVVVPSKHSAQTFGSVIYKDQSGQELRLQKPLLIAAEGFDASVFNTKVDENDGLGVQLDADFNFLSVGLGLDKGMEEDRKNISGLIKWFCQTFAGDERVGLVLKTNMVNSSLMDFETAKSRITQIKASTGCGPFPRIQLIHGRLSKKELANLYRHPKIKAYVTTTHGEGFGLPTIEAAACGLPVIATNWSGHLDFLHSPDGKRKFVPLDFDLKEIPRSSVWPGVMEQGTRWACVKEDDFQSKMKKVFLSIEKPKEWATELATQLAESHDEKKLAAQFVSALEQFLQEIPSAQNSQKVNDPKEVKRRLREQLQIPDEKKTLLFTMPMSAGDVFMATAVVDSLQKKFPEHLILFATDPKYAPILKDNPTIFKIIHFDNWMTNIAFCESVFDEVYTPNLAIQTVQSNWVHGGKGRLLGDEMAAQCQVEFGDYFIKTEPVEGLPEKYIVFHPGSGKGQWEARNYRHWKKVIKNLKKNFSDIDMKIVQVGLEDDPTFEGCVDLRGKTTYNQLATVIQNASCLVGIDSVTMHLAAAFKTNLVAIFGSSYATSTGPVLKHEGHNVILIDAPNRMGCEKACYKYQCVVDRESPCVNEIDPKQIVASVLELLGTVLKEIQNWDDCQPKIAGYTHVFNAETHGFPYVESISSMLGFCDEVIVVDGGSTDGTLEKIKAIGSDKIKIFDRAWDWNEPGMDGMQKAFGRAMTTVGPDDFLWQQDADEVVHEDDYGKVRKMADRFPSDVDLIHLPVVELWGVKDNVRTDRHSWKWRLSRNNFRVTHGINGQARVFDEKTGRTYAKKGMSDGCEYVDIMTNDHIKHKGFYSQELETLRQTNPDEYGKRMNRIFNETPSIFHYSWANLPRKIRNFKAFWNKCWSNLYNDPNPVDRFPDVQTEEDVVKKAKELFTRGGEHGQAKTFLLERTNPSSMSEWLDRMGKEYENAARGPVHNDEGSASTPQEVAVLPVEVREQGAVSTDGGARPAS